MAGQAFLTHLGLDGAEPLLGWTTLHSAAGAQEGYGEVAFQGSPEEGYTYHFLGPRI